MNSATEGVTRLTEQVLAWLPRLAAAIIILIIGALIAAALRAATRKGLEKLRLAERLHSGQGGAMLSRAVPHPERLIAKVIYWVVMLGVISLAVSVLGIAALTAFVAAIYDYLPHVLAALLIFLVASAVAAGASGLVARTMGDTPTSKVVGTAVPFVVMGIAGFMILDELLIAQTIVTITYGALLGAVALGLALAFGLGGRGVAASLLEDAYRKGKEQRGQVKRDAATGKQRAEADAQEAARKARHRR